eukprot:3518374-Amphidinium_carterae.2
MIVRLMQPVVLLQHEPMRATKRHFVTHGDRPSPVVADESDDDGQHVRADASDARVKDVELVFACQSYCSYDEDEVRPSAIASAPTYAGSQAEDFDDALTRTCEEMSH